MGERLGRAGRQPGALFLSIISFLATYLRRTLISVGGTIYSSIENGLSLIGTWFTSLLKLAARGMWAFLGRCGLALRNLLNILVWQPLSSLTRPIRQAIQRLFLAIWTFVGRCGLALRNLLKWYIWRPFYFITTPLRWFYGKVLQRPVDFAILSLRTFFEWVVVDILVPGAKAAPTATLAAGKKSAQVLAATRDSARTAGQHVTEIAETIGLPESVEERLPKPRISRFTTAIVSTSLVLLLSFLSTQERQPSNVTAIGQLTPPSGKSALAPLVPKMTNTPTVTPSPLPTAPSTPQPTPVEQLVAWPTPDPLGKGGSVAFTLRQEGNDDIYALSIGRPEPLRLTNHPADDRDPAWSPDGRQLAFASQRDGNWDIYLLDLKSADVRRLTQDPGFDGAPSWSPDGQWLAFESYRDGNLDLYVLAVDGNSPAIRVTEDPALDFAPAWSPDGRHLAFVSRRSGNNDIFVLALDQAFDKFAVNVTLSPDRQEDHPSWEPEGHYLAYYDDVDGLELIYALPMTEYQVPGEAFTIGQGRHPSWAPDGGSLVYVHSTGEQSYVIASSVDAWSAAPQAFATAGYLDDLDWSGVILPPDLEEQYPRDQNEREPLFVERSDPPQREGPAFLLREIEVDAPAPYLSDRVDDSFQALRARINADAGWDFLGQVDNMFAFLTSRPFPGESERSWNKAARAFDFYYRYPISIEPQVEVVREDRGGQTFWRIFIRAANQDGSHGEPIRQLPWDFSARYDSDPQYYDQGGKYKESIPSGYYIDFTQLAADYGWSRVPALDNWRTFFQGLRYWHFENRQGLNWDGAILELYSAEEIEQAYANR